MKEQTSPGLHTETPGEQVSHKNFLFTHYILFSLPFIILPSHENVPYTHKELVF
jgi:hypothetical protein